MKQNITGKFLYSIRREQRLADSRINQPLVVAKPAFLGDNSGVMDTYNSLVLPEGYVVVRDFDGNLSVAWNDQVPLIPNLAIIVGYDPIKPVLFQVLAVRDYLPTNAAAGLMNHHKTHEWPGSDTVFIHSEQFLPGMLFANNAFTVTIFPFFFKKLDGSRGYIDYQTMDLTSYIPTTGAQAFTLAATDAETLQIVTGGTKGSIGALISADFPQILDGTLHELWGVRLFDGQTEIRQTKDAMDTFDFRFGGVGGGGMGHVILDPTSAAMAQRANLEFVGAGVTVSDSLADNRTTIQVSPTLLPEIVRWSGAAGQTTFDYPDFVQSIGCIRINGVTEDPLTYALSADASQVVLDTALPYAAVITSDYYMMEI